MTRVMERFGMEDYWYQEYRIGSDTIVLKIYPDDPSDIGFRCARPGDLFWIKGTPRGYTLEEHRIQGTPSHEMGEPYLVPTGRETLMVA